MSQHLQITEAPSKEDLVASYLKRKTKKRREAIVVAYRRLIEHIARKLSFRKSDVEDLAQVGTIGLLKALKQYDPTKEATFTTFATTNIIGEIRHYLRDKGSLVKIPRRLQELCAKTNQAIRTLTQEKGRYPTIPEISEFLDIPEESILESMEAGQNSHVLSLDKAAFSGANRDSNSGASLLDSIKSDTHAEGIINKESLKDALKGLSDREQHIIHLRFFDGLTQKEIADTMALSQMHISRLITHTLDRLRNTLEKKQAE